MQVDKVGRACIICFYWSVSDVAGWMPCIARRHIHTCMLYRVVHLLIVLLLVLLNYDGLVLNTFLVTVLNYASHLRLLVQWLLNVSIAVCFSSLNVYGITFVIRFNIWKVTKTLLYMLVDTSAFR